MRIIRLTYLMEHDIKELLIESQEEGFFLSYQASSGV